MKDWTQVDIYTTTEGIEPVGAVLLEMGLGGYAVQDSADFEEFLQGKSGHWDYIDDELMKLKDSETTVTAYLPNNQQGTERLATLKSELERLKGLDGQNQWGRLEYALAGIREEDWANAWKQYYNPVSVGKRLVVCPSWEDYHPTPEQVVVRLDPGMAFGTGTHESTRLCMQLLEQTCKGGERILDMGCGSGILAVTGILLGAKEALGVDIDQTAVKVARENAMLNGVEAHCSFEQGNLVDKVDGTFHIVLANIVADVIMKLAPDLPPYMKPNGVLITSGIIDARADDVRQCLELEGYRIISQLFEGGWVAFMVQR